ncbi:uncharacterized protein LOC135387018 isoform X2 [Ornithodoros turicata]|uniref:uncharacterized protein LOC135387018 isoform X2 n=1 Tax=Ornithodoros turicata TaxID=34597 RepID=UPI003138E72E
MLSDHPLPPETEPQTEPGTAPSRPLPPETEPEREPETAPSDFTTTGGESTTALNYIPPPDILRPPQEQRKDQGLGYGVATRYAGTEQTPSTEVKLRTSSTTTTSTSSPIGYGGWGVLRSQRLVGGIHLYETIPHQFIPGNKSTCYTRIMPLGFGTSVTFIHVVELTSPSKTVFVIRHHTSTPLGRIGRPYAEYVIENQRLTFSAIHHGHYSKTMQPDYDLMPGLHVLLTQLAVDGKLWVGFDDDSFYIMAKDDFPAAEFEHCKIHRVDDDFGPLTIHEIHITYAASVSTVFDEGDDFVAPESGLFPGGYVIWEGDATGEYVVHYHGSAIYSNRTTGTNLRLIMLVATGRVSIGIEGEQPRHHNIAANGAYTLKISLQFKMKNFTMVTGQGNTVGGGCNTDPS